ncbi:MAG: signal peptidase II [Oscillospiraceae bacterium]|jgi:signal peptidase II|nr:signal peptidase II [Oscillospiraceae bacterium]
MGIRRFVKPVIAIASAAALTAAAYGLRKWVQRHLHGGSNPESKVLIPHILGLRYIENTGVSFGAFAGSRSAMVVITVLTAAAMLALLVWILSGKMKGFLQYTACTLILAGGLSNVLERLLAQWTVIDYFEFLFIRFAIFNFADCCITCGAVLLAIWVVRTDLQERRQKRWEAYEAKHGSDAEQS